MNYLQSQRFLWPIVVFFVLFSIACGIIFETTTIIAPDETTSTVIDITIDKTLLMQAEVNQRWQQQMVIMEAYLESRGARVELVDTDRQSGLRATLAFPNLVALNESLSGDDLSLFNAFTLRRWRGEYVFEARTTSALIRQRMMEITGFTADELFLVQFPLNIRLMMPGEIIRSSASVVDPTGLQSWQINWMLDEEHLLYANTRVPLIPPVINEPANGTRIRDASAGVDFRGTGEPGADLRLFRVDQEYGDTLLAKGVIGADGAWELNDVLLGEPGMYTLQAEEATDHETLRSQQPTLEFRPREPIVFVPGYYACSEGIFGTQIDWHWWSFPSNDPNWLNTGLIPFVTTLYYGPLFDYFLLQGYELGKDLFVACYDWTASLPEEARKLSDVLDWARAYNTSKLPVTVITHSNGGLITRYHVQNDPLRTYNQISDVIQIAPPNHGVVKAYYAWEGGDITKEGSLIKNLVAITLYRQCDIWPPVPGLPGYDARLLGYQKDVFSCIRYGEFGHQALFDLRTAPDDQIVSLGWLLSGCQNLEGCPYYSYPDAPVQRLNQPEQLKAFFTGIQGNLYVLTGNIGDHSTLAKIPFIPASDSDYPLWHNGKPDEQQSVVNQPGDGTVLNQSSWLPEADAFPGRYFALPTYAGADHAKGMVQRLDVLSDISSIIRENLPDGRERVTDVSDIIIVWVESPVNLLVRDALGRQAGIDQQGQEHREIPETAYGETNDPLGPKFLLIANPEPGEMKFVVSGQADGEYTLKAVSLVSEQIIVDESGDIQANQVREYKKSYINTTTTNVPPAGSPGTLPPGIQSRLPGLIFCLGGVALVGTLVMIGISRQRRKKAEENIGEMDWSPENYDEHTSDDTRKKRGWFRRKKDDQDWSG